jgi:hypothetical protein
MRNKKGRFVKGTEPWNNGRQKGLKYLTDMDGNLCFLTKLKLMKK